MVLQSSHMLLPEAIETEKNLLATERLLVFCTFPEASMLVSSCTGIEGAFLTTERVHKLEGRMWLPDLMP
jgi:hypothetical protein